VEFEFVGDKGGEGGRRKAGFGGWSGGGRSSPRRGSLGEWEGEDGGALEDDLASGSEELDGEVEAGGGACAVDDDVLVLTTTDLRNVAVPDSPAFAEGELLGVLAEEADGGVLARENLGGEEGDGPVAEDGDVGLALDADGLGGVECGGEGVGEEGVIVGDGSGDFDEVGKGKGEAIGEGAVVAVEAEDFAVGAVDGQPGAAAGAVPADDVGGTDDAFSFEKGGRLGVGVGGGEGDRDFDDGDELMSECGGVGWVADGGEVEGGDAHAEGAEDGLARRGHRFGVVGHEARGGGVMTEGPHGGIIGLLRACGERKA
jgi:hypothetical protein